MPIDDAQGQRSIRDAILRRVAGSITLRQMGVKSNFAVND